MTINEILMMLKSVLHSDWEMEKIIYNGRQQLHGFPFIMIGLIKCILIMDDEKTGLDSEKRSELFMEEIRQIGEFSNFQVIQIPSTLRPDINLLLDRIYEGLDKDEYHQMLISDSQGETRIVPVPMEWCTEVYSKEIRDMQNVKNG
jgi:hypothetical protein